MYLDTDLVLGLLKDDDWLSEVASSFGVADAKTSTSTVIEVQYVLEDVWPRQRLVSVHSAITDQEVELVPLTAEILEAAGDIRGKYERVNVFDSIHLGTAVVLEEPIVSTDTLYPTIEDVTHIDPRAAD